MIVTTTNQSGLQRLQELAPSLKASTARFKKHNDELAAKQFVQAQSGNSLTQSKPADNLKSRNA